MFDKKMYMVNYNKNYIKNNPHRIKRLKRHHSRTKLGLSYNMYKTQLSKSIDRGHDKPEYDLNNFRLWLFNQPNFNKLYNNWVKSKYDTKLRPSVDRIDSTKGYYFSNIQLMTWEGNNMKGVLEKSKAVYIFDSSGIFIKEIGSTRLAGEFLNVSQGQVSTAALGKNLLCKGFIIIYKNENVMKILLDRLDKIKYKDLRVCEINNKHLTIYKDHHDFKKTKDILSNVKIPIYKIARMLNNSKIRNIFYMRDSEQYITRRNYE